MCDVPGERLSPHSLPTPSCPTGHLALLLSIFLINCLSQRQKHCWEAAYFVHLRWGWCEHSTQCWEVPVQTSTLTYPAAKPLQIPTGLSEETSDPPEIARDNTRATGMQGTLTSLPSSLSPASKPLWSVGRYSSNPKRSWLSTLSFCSCVGM